MDPIQGITGQVTAAKLAETQMALSLKVLKLAQAAQAAPAAELLDRAVENLESLIGQVAGDLGGNLDAHG